MFRVMPVNKIDPKSHRALMLRVLARDEMERVGVASSDFNYMAVALFFCMCGHAWRVSKSYLSYLETSPENRPPRLLYAAPFVRLPIVNARIAWTDTHREGRMTLRDWRMYTRLMRQWSLKDPTIQWAPSIFGLLTQAIATTIFWTTMPGFSKAPLFWPAEVLCLGVAAFSVIGQVLVAEGWRLPKK